MPGSNIQDAISYVSHFFSRYIDSLKTSLIFASGTPEIQFSRVCIDVVPGFSELTEEKRHEVIRLAFAKIQQEITDNFSKTTPQMGATAIITISFVEKKNGLNQAHIYTANVGDNCGYFLIRNKHTLDVKKCERLNALHNLQNQAEQQRVVQARASVEGNRINGETSCTRMLGAFYMKQFLSSEPEIKHHTIPIMDGEELIVMHTHNRSAITRDLDIEDLQGKDAQLVQKTSRAIPFAQLPYTLMGKEINCAHGTMIVHRPDVPNVQQINPHTILTEPVLTGVVNGDSGGDISDYIARNLPSLINTYTENQLANGEELQANLISQRANIICEIERKTHNNIIEQISDFNTKKQNINNIAIFFKASYPIDKFTGIFKEYSAPHPPERGVDDQVIAEFEEMLSKMNEVLSAQHIVDYHRNTKLDKFLLFKEHTNSWQELIKELRAHAINWLKRIAESYDDPAQAAQFLQKYRDNPIFSQHRGNHWFQKIGRTASVIDIDKYIVNYLEQVPKVKLVSVK